MLHARDGSFARQVDRQYMSVTLGCPKTRAGRVEANVGRDLRDRKRMAAFTAHSTL
jgi:tRNA pseudouridine synthase 2